MCILSPTPAVAQPCLPAPVPQRLPPPQRQQLACAALAGHSVSALAEEYQVSRKFVYQQLHQANDALDQAFTAPAGDADTVLFSLPVTKDWLRQLVLGLVLICHSSLRGDRTARRPLRLFPLSGK